jgi:hypothetical protein
MMVMMIMDTITNDDDDDRGDYDYGDALNSYDSSYDEFTVNGTRYIVMKYN